MHLCMVQVTGTSLIMDIKYGQCLYMFPLENSNVNLHIHAHVHVCCTCACRHCGIILFAVINMCMRMREHCIRLLDMVAAVAKWQTAV